MSSLCSLCGSRLFSLCIVPDLLSDSPDLFLQTLSSSSFFFLCSSLLFSSFSIRDVVAWLISLYRVGTRWTSFCLSSVPILHMTRLSLYSTYVCIPHIHACTHSSTHRGEY